MIMDYNELKELALQELRSSDTGPATNGERAIAYAILALAERQRS